MIIASTIMPAAQDLALATQRRIVGEIVLSWRVAMPPSSKQPSYFDIFRTTTVLARDFRGRTPSSTHVLLSL
jgi:hypothetical protein